MCHTLPSNCSSLAAHVNTIIHILPDVECTILFHPNYFESEAVLKCVFTYFFKRGWKRDLFDPTVPKTIFSDILYSVRDLYAFEVLAVIKCLLFDSL